MGRKTLIIVALLAVQTATAQVRFGLKAGFTGANMKTEVPAGEAGVDAFLLPAFQGGAVADIPLTKWLAVQPALLYSTKGYRTRPEANTGNWYFIAKYRYDYLELPVNFLYKGALGTGKVFVGLGPSLAYGIGGRATYIQDGTKSATKKVVFNGNVSGEPADEVHASRVDVAANFLVGYEFTPGFLLSAGYAAGLLDVNPDAATKQLHRNFTISFGYLFPRK